MKKSEMYNLVVDKVCEICEVRRDTVINGRKMQAVVDARILIVQYLKRIGLSSDDIALMVLRELAGDPSLCPPLSELKKKAAPQEQAARIKIGQVGKYKPVPKFPKHCSNC